MSKYIYHHLGMGDHIICNGLVRNIVSDGDDYKLLCYHHNADSVRYMYRDIPNLSVVPVDGDAEADALTRTNDSVRAMIGDNTVDLTGLTFAEAFYKILDIDYSCRWDDFYIERDIVKEKELFDSYGLVENEYAFVHTDPKRGMNLRPCELPPSDICVMPDDRCPNIFLYMYMLENAHTYHGFDSSFLLLTDSLDKVPESLHLHRYIRKPSKVMDAQKLKNQWNYIY